MNKTELLLKEYETLRQESLDSINNRSQIVSFGLGTIGLLAAGVLASERASSSLPVLSLVFCLAIPTISILVLYSWLGEVERMMRAGRFLVDLEARINAEIDSKEPTLTWESRLRSGSTQMRYPYLVVLALFLGIAAGAPLVGLAIAWPAWRTYCSWIALPLLAVLFVAYHMASRARTFR